MLCMSGVMSRKRYYALLSHVAFWSMDDVQNAKLVSFTQISATGRGDAHMPLLEYDWSPVTWREYYSHDV